MDIVQTLIEKGFAARDHKYVVWTSCHEVGDNRLRFEMDIVRNKWTLVCIVDENFNVNVMTYCQDTYVGCLDEGCNLMINDLVTALLQAEWLAHVYFHTNVK